MAGFKFRLFHLFILLLTCVWVLVINQIGTVRVLDRVLVFSNLLPNEGLLDATPGGAEGVQVYTAVGFAGCEHTELANNVLAKIKSSHSDTVFIYSWTAPTKAEFDEWLESRKDTAQVPAEHNSAPVIFNRLNQRRVFLGGVTELLGFVQARFPEIDFSPEIAESARLQSASRARSWRRRVRSGTNGDSDLDLEEAAEAEAEAEADAGLADSARSSDEISPTKSAASMPASPASSKSRAASADPVNRWEVQVPLKKNKLFTTYRLAEGKSVTNYRPIMQQLKTKGWSYMQTAPLLSGWIFVQDQATAAQMLKRYRKAIINNIGYGGQSCFGGTKGTQLRCRAEFAQKNGCDYDQLGIQPAQYRLWIADECQRFFEVACKHEPNRMWMEKPSGGQHGAGMQPRAGCAPIRAAHPSCSAEATRKKFIIMPYLTPALLSRHKFDVRSFLVVASLDPQLVFYHDGFARKANSAYSDNLADRNAHITNANSQSSEDHFYGFERLQRTLHEESGFPADYMERVFRPHAIKVQNYVFQVSRPFVTRRKGVYQVFALDWIIDSNGGIHMLEANSNPLVTVFQDLQKEFTETWDSLTDLVLAVQTEPDRILTPEHPRLVTEPVRFQYRGWHLVFNELEERVTGAKYNPCEQRVEQFDLAAYKRSMGLPDSGSEGGDRVAAGPDATSAVDFSSGGSDQDAGRSEEGEPSLDTMPEEDDDDRSMNDSLEISTGAADLGAGGDESVSLSSGQGVATSARRAETPYEISVAEIQDAIKKGAQRPCVQLDPFQAFRGCMWINRGLGPEDRAVRCEFTEGGFVYLIEPSPAAGEARAPPTENASPACLPMVMITAGMHGNEQAGIVAARHIRNSWTPRRARLIVVERLNARGAERRGRYIPKQSKQEQDLNRNFPASGLVGELAREIWTMVSKIQPHVFIDMHEGWGFYNRLRANYQKGGQLVGNPKFSKGSSVISSPSALPLAKYMINRVNELTVTDHGKDFLSIVPPIETGLANMVMREFDALVIVIETTSGNQQLGLRAQQQLVLASTYFALLGVLPADFDGRTGFDSGKACVAGLGSCKLQHPGDVKLEARAGVPSPAGDGAVGEEKEDDAALELAEDGAHDLLLET